MKKQLKTLNSHWTLRSTRSHDDKFSIRCATWKWGASEPRRYIVYLNGRTEWIEKNMELPELLGLTADCGFLTLDHRGQGASGGERAYVGSYDDYILDAKRVIEECISGKPYCILAHSMGGLIAIYGAQKGVFTPFAMALCSPLLKLSEHPLPNFVASPVSKVLSFVGFGGVSTGAGNHNASAFASNRLTHDLQNYEILCDSPYRVPSATFGWVASTFAALKYVHSPLGLAKLSAPTLVLSPTEESVVDPKGQQQWVQSAVKFSKVHVQLLNIHGGRHELLNESPQFRDQTINACKSWFKDFV